MDLNMLGCFLTLSENLNFTQTAKILRLTQPSVSRQLKQLEESLKGKGDPAAVLKGIDLEDLLKAALEVSNGVFEKDEDYFIDKTGRIIIRDRSRGEIKKDKRWVPRTTLSKRR